MSLCPQIDYWPHPTVVAIWTDERGIYKMQGVNPPRCFAHNAKDAKKCV